MLIIKYLISWGYRVLLVVYSWLLQLNVIKRHRFDRPIISIGNIALGGSGKTPFVFFISNLLSKQGFSHVIISRGYKKVVRGTVLVHDGKKLLVRSPDVCGDEPFMLASKLKSIPVVVDEKKQRAIKSAIKQFNPQIILLDDGFQSRYLDGMFNIVLLNALDKPQDLRLFPLGKLREPIPSLDRASVLIITKGELVKKQGGYVPHSLPFLTQKKGLPCFHSQMTFNLLHSPITEKLQFSSLIKIGGLPAASKLLGCCGIGDPKSFQLSLNFCKKQVVTIQSFSDHYSYIENYQHFLNLLRGLVQKNKINGLITTYKDFIKIKDLGRDFNRWAYKNNFNFFILDMGLALNSTDEELIGQMIKNLNP